MNDFSRRTLVKGAGMVGLAASGGLLDFATAFAQQSQWKPEPGATLNVLRWKRFVQAEDDAFMKMVDAFSKAMNVKVNVSERILRRHPAQGFGRRKYRTRSRHRVGIVLAAAAVSREVHQGGRRCRLSRQEIRRLAALACGIRQVQGPVDRHSRRGERRSAELPYLGDGEGGIQNLPDRLPVAFSNCARG